MKQNARKKKIHDSLKAGGFGDGFSKMASDMMHREAQAPLEPITQESMIDHSKVMLFDGSTNELGATVYNAVSQYQQESFQKCSDKFATLHEYLQEQGPTGKPNIASPVRHRDFKEDSGRDCECKLPDLAAVLMLPNGSSYEDLPGSSPWLVSQRPWVELMHTKAFPLAGMASLAQCHEYSYSPVSFICVPIQALLSAGLTVLSDLPGFCKHDSGVELFREKSIVVTLERPQHLLWIPEGTLAIPIGREPYSEKTQRSCTYWVKTFLSPADSYLIPHSVWTATKLLNSSYLRKLQGQKCWKQRNELFEKFCTDRSALVLGFHEDTAPTVIENGTQDIFGVDTAADALAAAAEANKKDSDDDLPLAATPQGRPRPRATPKMTARSSAASAMAKGAAKPKAKSAATAAATKLGGRAKPAAKPPRAS